MAIKFNSQFLVFWRDSLKNWLHLNIYWYLQGLPNAEVSFIILSARALTLMENLSKEEHSKILCVITLIKDNLRFILHFVCLSLAFIHFKIYFSLTL